MNIRLKLTPLGRWILQHPLNDTLAWSGMRWAEIDLHGFPTGAYQVSNFATKDEAADYAREYGFTVPEEVV